MISKTFSTGHLHAAVGQTDVGTVNDFLTICPSQLVAGTCKTYQMYVHQD